MAKAKAKAKTKARAATAKAKTPSAKPAKAKPATAKPATAKPAKAKAAKAKPANAKPAKAKPAAAKPAKAKPAPAKPATRTAKPAPTKPATRTAKPAPTKPGTRTAKPATPAPREEPRAQPSGELPAFDFAGLEDALADAARAAFADLRAEYPRHRFYCLSLYTAGGLDYVIPTAMSEEGLAEVVADYRDKPGYAATNVKSLAESLRWSPDDSPHHGEGDDHFDDATARMRELGQILRGIDVTDERARFDAIVARAHEAFFAALHRLDEEGCFGAGAARERVFVSMMMGDQDRSVLALGQRLNPPATYERYRAAYEAR